MANVHISLFYPINYDNSVLLSFLLKVRDDWCERDHFPVVGNAYSSNEMKSKTIALSEHFHIESNRKFVEKSTHDTNLKKRLIGFCISNYVEKNFKQKCSKALLILF